MQKVVAVQEDGIKHTCKKTTRQSTSNSLATDKRLTGHGLVGVMNGMICLTSFIDLHTTACHTCTHQVKQTQWKNTPVWIKVTKNSQCCKIMYELMFTNLNYFKLHF